MAHSDKTAKGFYLREDCSKVSSRALDIMLYCTGQTDQLSVTKQGTPEAEKSTPIEKEQDEPSDTTVEKRVESQKKDH